MEELKKVLRITYDPVIDSIQITDNDFTTFEALGILETAKTMISYDWISSYDERG